MQRVLQLAPVPSPVGRGSSVRPLQLRGSFPKLIFVDTKLKMTLTLNLIFAGFEDEKEQNAGFFMQRVRHEKLCHCHFTTWIDLCRLNAVNDTKGIVGKI